MLSKADIFAANDRKIEAVDVPEWNCTLFVRSMNGLERNQWATSCEPCYVEGKLVDWSLLQTRLLIATVCDDKGKLVFDDKDAAPLSQRNAAVLNRIFKASAKLNALYEAAEAEAKKN